MCVLQLADALRGGARAAPGLLLACALLSGPASLPDAAAADSPPPEAETRAAAGPEDAPSDMDRLVEASRLLGSGQYDEGLAAARALVADLEARESPDRVLLARTLATIASISVSARRIVEGETLEYARRARDLFEQEYGAEHAYVARSYMLLGACHVTAGNPEVGIPPLEKAIEILRSIAGGDDPSVEPAMGQLTAALIAAGRYEEAAELVDRRRAILDAAEGDFEIQRMTVESNAADVALRLGRYREAREAFLRDIETKKRVLGEDHPRTLRTIANLGVAEMQFGDYPEAQGRFETVLSAWEARGTLETDYAGALHNLAIIHGKLGRIALETETYERALALQEEMSGKDHPLVTKPLIALGSQYAELGRYADAERSLERAVRIIETRLGPDHPDVGVALENLGTLQYRFGDVESARTNLERAVAVTEAAMGPDNPEVARMLGNLSLVVEDMEDPGAARPLLLRAIAIDRDSLDPTAGPLLTKLANLADLEGELGNLDRTEELLRELLAVREASAPGHPKAAYVMEELGRTVKRHGPPGIAEARTLFERARDLRIAVYGERHPSVATPLVNLATLDLEAGDYAGAVDHGVRAEDIARDHLRLVAGNLAERKALEYVADRQSGLPHLTSAAAVAGSPDLTRRAWDAWVRSRAVVLDAVARRNRSVETGSTRDALAEARTRLANLLVRGSDDDPETFARIVREARDEVEALEEALARSGDASVDDDASVGLDEVAAALPEGTALIGFVRYDQQATAAHAAGEKNAPAVGDRYAAFVLRAEDPTPVMVPLGAARAIEDAVDAWRRALVESLDEPAYRAAGVALRRAVWEPWRDRIGGAERVFLVPDGALHRVHFGVLPVGEDRYLVDDGPDVHVLSVERELVTRGAASVGRRRLLSVGGPDFDARAAFAALRPAEVDIAALPEPARLSAPSALRGPLPDCPEFRDMRFEPLAAARREADEVAALWTGDDGARPATRLTGAAATEAAVKRTATDAGIVHLATHAFVLREECGERALSDGDRLRGVVPENPLRLSGLAFAGANNRGAAGPDEDDGILTAEEVASLDLSAASWVVLSGCDTGGGELWSGEGILGLQRAFRTAGSRTLLMSLWPVRDRLVRRWVLELYRARLDRGLDTPGAVRAADRALLERTRRLGPDTHPGRWAVLVAVGDWR